MNSSVPDHMTVIPFAPSLAFFRRILKEGGNSSFSGKEWARTVVAGDRTLSVPVVGGSSILKHRQIDPSRIMIADHGAWRREHLGAWNSLYGKTPFFAHLYPAIEKAYAEESHGLLLEFNHSLAGIIRKFMDFDNSIGSLHAFQQQHKERYDDIRKDLETKVNLNYSIFDALFRLGRNTIFLL